MMERQEITEKPNRFQRLLRLRFSTWGGSVLVHLLLLLLCLLLFGMQRPFKGSPGERTARGGIVMKNESENGEVYTDGDSNSFDAEGARANVSIDEMLDESFAAEKLETVVPQRVIGAGTAVGTEPGHMGALNLNAGFAGAGDKGTGAGSGGGRSTVSFFGEGTGSSFVFVIDQSGSMAEDGQRPFLAAKRQLIQAIESLQENCEFNVIFYNDNYFLLFPSLKKATDANKSTAKKFIHSRIPADGTKHGGPLFKAIQMQPDVIFFLTDGDAISDLPPREVDQLSRFNARSKAAAQINTIRFGTSDRDGGFMRKLAEENSGQYRFVNIRMLSP